MGMRVLGACVAAAALAGGASMSSLAAPAGPASGGQGPGALRMLLSGQVGRVLTLRSELQMTEEQREQIRQIVQGHRAEIVAVAKPLADKRRALREATLAETTDDAAIRAAANELGAAIGDAAVLGAKVKAEVVKVMTPEQRTKIDDFRKQADAAVDQFMHESANAT